MESNYYLQYFSLSYKHQPYALAVLRRITLDDQRRGVSRTDGLSSVILSMRAWCTEKFGSESKKGRWRNTGPLNTFRFRDQTDAFEFKMRFG
ncbi:MAG: hypothetical protein EOP83_34650 [Verrucomicrobiaceae bacterium]|nr:MAG: hypothetical protein EOP83_34650 [Verrucomicrobiaceae bacterium]